MSTLWTQQEAVCLCLAVEAVCQPFGCHVALTGGCLYKESPRKDCDLLLYRIRQVHFIDWIGLETALFRIGVKIISGFGWCYKADFQGKLIDIFVPEEDAVYGAPIPPEGQQTY